RKREDWLRSTSRTCRNPIVRKNPPTSPYRKSSTSQRICNADFLGSQIISVLQKGNSTDNRRIHYAGGL
ncbi:unnamed protein product, partial [Amoebophrya sp. A120]